MESLFFFFHYFYFLFYPTCVVQYFYFPFYPTCVFQLLSCVWLFATLWTVACQAPLFMEFPRQKYWSGLPFPSLGNLPDPGIEPVVSDSLLPHRLYSPRKSPGQNTGVGSLFLLQGIFLTQELNWGILHCRRILYQLNYQGKPPALAGRFFTAEPPGKPRKVILLKYFFNCFHHYFSRNYGVYSFPVVCKIFWLMPPSQLKQRVKKYFKAQVSMDSMFLIISFLPISFEILVNTWNTEFSAWKLSGSFQGIKMETSTRSYFQLLKPWETQVWSLGWEDPLEKEMATHSNTLA